MAILIDPLTRISLYLECQLKNQTISSGTGFIVEKNSKKYLITNRHVITGRDIDTNNPLSSDEICDPDTIVIWHHVKNKLGSWIAIKEPLYNDKTYKQLWIEDLEKKIDVIALPLKNVTDEVQIYPLDLQLINTDLILFPSEPVSIIGFPLGKAVDGKFPIWKTGHIASDIDINYNRKPVFLIDATTREGMSGSPVIARRMGSCITSTSIDLGRNAIKFLGIYSGRTNINSDIGLVWKPKVLDKLII